MSNSWFDERNRPQLNRIKNKYPQKDQTEPFFRKTPGNFQWEVIPGGSGPYVGSVLDNVSQNQYKNIQKVLAHFILYNSFCEQNKKYEMDQ